MKTLLKKMVLFDLQVAKIIYVAALDAPKEISRLGVIHKLGGSFCIANSRQ
ncbi:hypothetical protein NG798_10740 [Ancylothrix sp. C2]|uniref:hypothetical protein n=1 Tax=Ancylothrix sp. D3o TaxID=2953691 RepID=UPI0021BA83CE|nr:hypothetical protein [Ancylothrix sp. D3o]MCT7950265.1 hypothetical protein [Ancylothrix sp. D3o]